MAHVDAVPIPTAYDRQAKTFAELFIQVDVDHIIFVIVVQRAVVGERVQTAIDRELNEVGALASEYVERLLVLKALEVVVIATEYLIADT